ncbi:hypothetical protein NX794_02425 [Streptomyces sp. LP11]|uniref:Proline rich protein membrane protein n=1 Tax=Streptomyces pyxinicus TaxID=2970331 RepID=A0ABT2AV24_9ACTN|nr:hypothetical protein [Streptomyces sp. LP11]MCS0600097.1 hypothetical protein [Streptomyces sp. LP11]
MSGPVPPGRPRPYPGGGALLLWRRRRSPLCRRTDRVQGRIAVVLLLLVPLLGSLAAVAVEDTARRHYRASAEHQRQTRQSSTAVLVGDAPRHPEPGSAEALATRYPVTVRLTDPQHGRTRTATAEVPPGLTAGSAVRVWVGADGAVTEPPMTDEEVRSRGVGWAILVFLAVALAGAAVHGAAALLLRRRNLAAWDAEWAGTAPRWTTST